MGISGLRDFDSIHFITLEKINQPNGLTNAASTQLCLTLFAVRHTLRSCALGALPQGTVLEEAKTSELLDVSMPMALHMVVVFPHPNHA